VHASLQAAGWPRACYWNGRCRDREPMWEALAGLKAMRQPACAVQRKSMVASPM
jgi:hypothetical protein